jgi:large subunit ribosomal protein L30
MATGTTKGGTIRVTQVRSGIGFAKPQRRILRALGLGKMHRTVELPDSDAVRGMIRAISHLVRVEGDRPSSTEEAR